MKKSKQKTHLTPNEVAELLMVNPITLRQWAARGVLRSITTPGGHRRFLLSDIEEFARSRASAPATRHSKRPKRVLIVDDDPNLPRMLAGLINGFDSGIAIEIAHDAYEAGIKVESFRPHALLLDLMMPGIDGFQVCRLVRARPTLNHMRIIAMTGFPSQENIDRIMSAGADACLPKPLDAKRVLVELGLLAPEAVESLETPDNVIAGIAVTSESTDAIQKAEGDPSSSAFVGRLGALPTLSAWAFNPESDPILLVHGPAGIGKTAVCNHLLERTSELKRPWCRYSFSPGETGVAGFCRQVLMMSPESHPTQDMDPSDAVRKVIERLRGQPYLLFIDGLEHLLVRSPRLNGSSTARASDSAYSDEVESDAPMSGAGETELAELLQALAVATSSKILITSQLVPDALLDASGEPIGGVQLMSLGGLGPTNTEELFRANGIVGTLGRIERFFEPVDFNPGVIQLVMRMIHGERRSGGNFDHWSRTLIEESGLTAVEQTLKGRRIYLLRMLLQKHSPAGNEVWPVSKLLKESADRSEMGVRAMISSGDLEKARSRLGYSIFADPARVARLGEEFGFLFAFDPKSNFVSLRADLEHATVDWQRGIWSALAMDSPQALPHSRRPEPAALTGTEDCEVTPSPAKPRRAPPETLSAEAKGEQLEQAVSRLFRTFFRVGEETPWKIRRQKRGTQNGYDLSIEWSGSCETTGAHKARVHVECKNYRDPLSHDEVGGKLLMEGLAHPAVIDHWILISPHADPSNELSRFLEAHETRPQYAFDVQVWSPESGVGELFALEPEVYEELYRPAEREYDPRTWSNSRREDVQRRWKARLRPPSRLPRGWSDYARDSDKLCSPPEKPAVFQSAFEHAVPMRCLNSAGVLLDKPLREYVDEWLQSPDQQALFILGEFGDGKTFFTYALARELMSGWVPERGQGWLTLRLPLRKFVNNPRRFLRQRLEEFGANITGWLALGKKNKRLVILDGFDEMSVEVGPKAVTRNIGKLLACVKEFDGCKVLITSRTHFFESRVDAQRLMVRLGNPSVYHLAPIARQDVWRNLENHLTSTLGAREAQGRLARIERLNDPIGLAQKPLFLDMVKVVLSARVLPENLSIGELYETYINESLKRNEDRLDDGEFRADPAETIENLREILGELAEELQRSGQDWVSLSQFKSRQRKPFAELLWRLSGGGEEMEKDAQTRVGARSLLGRVSGKTDVEGWLVDFCHRSMREYFVAIRLCRAVEAGFKQGLDFLRSVPLNHEILHFATERWRRTGAAQVTARLLKLIEHAVPGKEPGLSGGYALTLLNRLTSALPRDFDWRGKILDGADLEDADLSGIDFSGSSFVAANLVNANLESTCCDHCDLAGVQLEETRSVVSLAAHPSGNEIVGLYSDGTLREWQLTLTGRATSQVALTVDPDADSAVGFQKGGHAWLRRGKRWSFLSRRKGLWVTEGTFPIKEDYECINPQETVLTYLRRLDDQSADFCQVDLRSHKTPASTRMGAAKRCAPLGTQGFVWSDAHGRLHFQLWPEQHDSPSSATTLEICSPPTALATWQCKTGCYLLGIGTEDGSVSVWRVRLTTGQWSFEQILKKTAHQGIVTALAFMNDSQIASGGSDRSIVVVRLVGPDCPEGADERRLTRTLRCRGMKINGCKGSREHEMLRGYIARCHEGV